jgi:hypothetical protein
MGVSEAVFVYSNAEQLRRLDLADSDLERGSTWSHVQLEDANIRPALTVQYLNKMLKDIPIETARTIKTQPDVLWGNRVQFTGIQITEPAIRACGYALTGRSPTIPRDMVTCTVQGQADVFNIWNGCTPNNPIKCMDRLYVCIVRIDNTDTGTCQFVARPGVGTPCGGTPLIDTIPRIVDEDNLERTLVYSFFIGTMVTQKRLRPIKMETLRNLFSVEDNQARLHPQHLRLQLVSVNVRM